MAFGLLLFYAWLPLFYGLVGLDIGLLLGRSLTGDVGSIAIILGVLCALVLAGAAYSIEPYRRILLATKAVATKAATAKRMATKSATTKAVTTKSATTEPVASFSQRTVLAIATKAATPIRIAAGARLRVRRRL